MSRTQAAEPLCEQRRDTVSLVIRSRSRDLGGFSVRRVLPAAERRMVGPFIFFDEMGPARFPPGEGINVRPHPHIGLATVTWLFDGEILHRDSLGYEQVIAPGAVNLMSAGRGIVHSERTPGEALEKGQFLHGLQIWMALPRDCSEDEPTFEHVAAEQIPMVKAPGFRAQVVIGRLGDVESPVKLRAETLYVVIELDADAEFSVPDTVPERALYVVDGGLDLEGSCTLAAGEMAVLSPGEVNVRARAQTRVALIGGEAFDPRQIWWNFVHTDPERIEQAKRDWSAGRFPTVPGDEEEFIPLPSS